MVWICCARRGGTDLGLPVLWLRGPRLACLALLALLPNGECTLRLFALAAFALAALPLAAFLLWGARGSRIQVSDAAGIKGRGRSWFATVTHQWGGVSSELRTRSAQGNTAVGWVHPSVARPEGVWGGRERGEIHGSNPPWAARW